MTPDPSSDRSADPTSLLPLDIVERLFPFYVSFDRDGQLARVGYALRRACPWLERAERVEEAFELRQPRIALRSSELEEHAGECFLLVIRNSELVLRGQMISLDARWLFCGFPAIDDLMTMQRLGLHVADFPHHTTFTDHWLALQGQALALASLERRCAGLEKKNAAQTALLNALPDLLLNVDRFGRIATLQAGAEARLWQRPEQRRPKSLGDVFEPQVAALLERSRVAVLAGTPQMYEFTTDVQGRRLDFEVRASESGLGNVLFVIRDITQRKGAEFDLVGAREAAVTGKFLATISHEMRTPMNAVIGLAELLADTPLIDEQREYVATLTRSGETLMALIDDMLDVSKLAVGKLEIEQLDFSVGDLLNDLAALFTPRARAKGLELRVRLAPDVPGRLVGDPKRIRQVVMNLLSNAVKFTHQGYVALRCEAIREGEAHLRLRVKDTGIGMNAETRSKLFTAFTQGDNSSSRVYGGAGLGLHICMRLAELMEGSLGVTSEEGCGTTFSLKLPLIESKLCGEGKHPPVEPPLPVHLRSQAPNPLVVRPTTFDGLATPGTRVLVVDDQAVNRLVVRRLLEKRGYSVTEAQSGRLAIEAQRRQSFDLILMDVQMPDMDGFETTLAIRAGGSRTPIVALTAGALPEDCARCLEHGMDAFLTKPLRGADLDRLLTGPRVGARSGTWPAVRLSMGPVVPALPRGAGLFDPTLLDDITGGDLALTRDYLDMTLAALTERFAELKAAAAAPECSPRVAMMAHTLKGLVASLARGIPVDLLNRIELSSGSKDALRVRLLVQQLEPLIQLLDKEVKLYRGAV